MKDIPRLTMHSLLAQVFQTNTAGYCERGTYLDCLSDCLAEKTHICHGLRKADMTHLREIWLLSFVTSLAVDYLRTQKDVCDVHYVPNMKYHACTLCPSIHT